MLVLYLLRLFLSVVPELVGLAFTAVSIALLYKYREEVLFLWQRVWYRFPLIGKARTLSRQLAVIGEGDDRWFLSERTLCGDFHAYLGKRITDPNLYELSKNYLRKVREIGRRPMSFGGWLLISILVFVESLGFAYVLTGYTLPGASEALQGPGAVLLALAFAIILVFITHHAGREWHKRTLIAHARVMWENRADQKLHENLVSERTVSLEDNSTDKDEKPYLQLLARLEANPDCRPGTPWMNIVMVGAILLMAGFAFYVRYETLQTNQTQCVLSQPGGSVPSILSGGSDLPDLVTKPDDENRRNGQSQACNAFGRASVATYLLLAILFVCIQIIGWILGFRSGFAGRESKDAWQRTHRFGNTQEYKNWMVREERRIIAISQGHLGNLQSLIRKRATGRTVNAEELALSRSAGTRTFLRYCKEEAGLQTLKIATPSGPSSPQPAPEPATGPSAVPGTAPGPA